MDQLLTLRPITPEDAEFLYRVYASTREEELAVLDWSDAQKNDFIRMQFHAQHQFYAAQFSRAAFQVVLADSEPVGRLYVDRRADEIHIIDIAILTEYRNRGIGSFFLRQILAEAEREGLPVRIYVEQFNPALRLYQRLGFRRVADHGVYFLMEWQPGCAGDSNIDARQV